MKKYITLYRRFAGPPITMGVYFAHFPWMRHVQPKHIHSNPPGTGKRRSRISHAAIIRTELRLRYNL